MSVFRKIDFSQLLKESLRNFFTVNKAGKLSIMYRFCLAVIYPLQLAWNDFEAYRQKTWLISQCKWQLGQLSNVLNMLYDPINKSIYLTQAEAGAIFAPTIDYNSSIFAPVISDSSAIFAPTIDNISNIKETVINIPNTITGDQRSDLIATIEKIRLLGLKYSINTF